MIPYLVGLYPAGEKNSPYFYIFEDLEILILV